MDEKIICALEDWDTVTDFYRPNGASRSWYLEETGQVQIPMMWGRWNVFNEAGYMHSKGILESLVTPHFADKVVFKEKDAIVGEEHRFIYLISVFNPSYFHINRHIGFKTISSEYLKGVREGRGRIVLTLPFEGYSGTDGNQDLMHIQKWIENANLPSSRVHYLTGNLIAKERGKLEAVNYEIVPIEAFDSWINPGWYNKECIRFEPSEENNLFLSYNRLPRPHRVYFLSMLESKGLLNKGKVSCGAIKDYNVSTFPGINAEGFYSLQKRTPLILNHNLVNNLAGNLDIEDHRTTFISAVTETLCLNGTLFLSEKIWKPIAVGHPFMVLGGKGTLNYLKDQGFKTYGKWVDERYDDEYDYLERARMITDELVRFSKMTDKERLQLREEMYPTALFNKEHFFNRIAQRYPIDNTWHFTEEGPNRPILKELERIWNLQ